MRGRPKRQKRSPDEGGTCPREALAELLPGNNRWIRRRRWKIRPLCVAPGAYQIARLSSSADGT